MGQVTIGEHNHLYPGVVIGGEPQDMSYRGSDTSVIIGDHNMIREGVTINRAHRKRRRRHADRQPQFSDGLLPCGPRLQVGQSHHHGQRHAARRPRSRSRSRLAVGRRWSASLRHDRQLRFVAGLAACCTTCRRSCSAKGIRLGRAASTSSRSSETISRPKRFIASPKRIACCIERKSGSITPAKFCERTINWCPQVNELLSFIQIQQEGKHGRSRERRRAA